MEAKVRGDGVSLSRDKHSSSRVFLQSSHFIYPMYPEKNMCIRIFASRGVSLCVWELRDNFGLSPRTRLLKTPLSDDAQYCVPFPVREAAVLILSTAFFAATKKLWVSHAPDPLSCSFQSSSHIAWALSVLQCGKMPLVLCQE